MSIQYNPSNMGEDGEPVSSLAWFVARLKPNGFALAELNLAQQGFATFMPQRECEIRHARQRRMVRRPLFPGYIFVGFDPDTVGWRAVNSTFGVAQMVMARAHTPQRVPRGLVAGLMAECDATGLILPPKIFHPGERVRVLRGPFRNLIAEVEQLSDGARVHLLLDLMGRSARTSCSREDLEIAAAP